MFRIGEIAIYGVPVALVLVGVLFALAAYYAFRARLWLWRIPGIAAVALSLMGFTGTFTGLPIVLTNQQLAFLPSWQYFSVLRLGVTTPGDAPAQWFIPSSSTCSISGGDVGSEVPSADGGCFNADPPASGLDLLEFGASKSATDNSTALQAWANQACNYHLTAPGSIFDFKAAPIAFPICNNGVVTGTGMYGTTLTYTGTNTTNDLVRFGPSANTGATEQGWTVTGLNVDSLTTMTNGTGIRLVNVLASTFQRDNAGGQYAPGSGNLFNGIWCDNCFDLWYDTFEASASNDVVRASGKTSHAQSGFTYSNCKISGGAIGIHLGGATGQDDPLNCQSEVNGVNLQIDEGIVAAGNLASLFDSASTFDSSTSGPNILINDSGFVSAQTLVFTGTWSCSAYTYGLYIQNINHQKVNANFGALCVNTLDGMRIDDATATVSDNNGPGIYSNGGYGINATSAMTTVYVAGMPPGNSTGPWNANALLGTVSCNGGTNCYTKDFAGNIHQYGVVGLTGAVNTLLTTTWTYPVTFPNAVFVHSLVCSPYGWENGTAQMTTGVATAPTTSSASIGFVGSTTVTTAQFIDCEVWGN